MGTAADDHGVRLTSSPGVRIRIAAGGRKRGRLTPLHEPGLREIAHQLADRAARDAETHIAEALRPLHQTGILIADVEAPQIRQLAIDNGHLAVVAPVEPVHAAPERGDIEGNQFDALPRHTLEKGGRGVDGAHVVVDHPDANAAPDGFRQFGGKGGAGAVGMDQVVFDEDEMFRRAERGVQRAEETAALGEEDDPVVPVGDRQDRGTKTPQQAHHPPQPGSFPGRVFRGHRVPLAP